jgi:hypothetical protein
VETKVKVEDEMLPQLSIHTVGEILTRAFVRKLANGDKFHNWKTKSMLSVFKK